MKFGLVGAMGKMGQAIARLAASSENLELVFGVESPGHGQIKKRYGSLVGVEKYDFLLGTFDDLVAVPMDGLIDFSSPESTSMSLGKACEKQIPIVIGTTGLTEVHIQEVKKASQRIPVLLSSNMSLGVNLLFWLVEKASHVLKDHSFNPEIVEIHHNQKKDAPSGTARTLEEIILKEFSWDQNALVHGRLGMTGARREKELGSHALRGGDVVGEHSVYFFGEGERLELSHQATDRNIFASGALKALLALSSRKPGLYRMQDILFAS